MTFRVMAIVYLLAVAAWTLGCQTRIGPEGRYLDTRGAVGFCANLSAGDYASVSLGFCTADGASTATLEHPEPEPGTDVDP